MAQTFIPKNLSSLLEIYQGWTTGCSLFSIHHCLRHEHIKIYSIPWVLDTVLSSTSVQQQAWLLTVIKVNYLDGHHSSVLCLPVPYINNPKWPNSSHHFKCADWLPVCPRTSRTLKNGVPVLPICHSNTDPEALGISVKAILKRWEPGVNGFDASPCSSLKTLSLGKQGL